MAKLIYMMNISFDGYTQDEHGDFTFTAPIDPAVHTFIFQHASSFRTLLYGRKVYETMLYWETAHTLPDQTPLEIGFARKWQAAEKIVYSKTLTEPHSANTTITQSFEPEAIRNLKANRNHDIAIAGPELAAQAIHAGLVDELQMRICPAIIGGGTRFFPTGVRLDLQLIEDRQFRNGEIFLRYAVNNQSK
ncbi:dihydrofolate reductase family protein [Acidicapsa dinghuensis]|uniref:Dihydrofolate reductase family protein n=1 Tax=Acidicapsa dinghuensis TaxID=2218256 RepID=A0ABW1EI61_9BACT|nr:dihydrofolate reductase family protein [Acidicapsa dinghuensis]